MPALPPGARVLVLTGAGVSAESGLPTFRGAGGFWENHRAQDLATPGAFDRDPALVHRFYNARRRVLLDGAVQPNAAHRALARLGQALGEDFLLVTQNVDDLHERGGSRRVLHMHGELLKLRCARSGRVFEATGDVAPEDCCACCGLPGGLRPHVVWFGEVPLGLEAIEEALARCGLFVSIGTSGQVWPAAGFVRLARQAGARTLELNLEESAGSGDFDESRRGPAGTLVPALVEELLAGRGLA